MMASPFSAYYDAEYRRLLNDGYQGWGGVAYERRHAGWAERMRALWEADVLGDRRHAVLELGCGNGMASYLLAAEGYHVTGIDISVVAIEWARARFERDGLSGTFHVADACDLGCLGPERFDVVIDGNCLHCEVGRRRLALLGEVRRVLRPRGRFIVSTMVGPARELQSDVSFDAATSTLIRPGHPPRALIARPALLEELSDAGFVVSGSHQSQNAWWDHLTLVMHVAADSAPDA